MYKEWCIFCAIAQHAFDTTAYILESETHCAFLSISPNTEWMTVVIPKAHFWSDCMHLPDEELAALMTAAKSAATVLENAYDEVWRIGIVMEWTGVDHAHVKLYPMHWTRWINDWEWTPSEAHGTERFEQYPWYLMTREWERVPDEELLALAERMRDA